MRSDYGLYIVALICFIIAAVFLAPNVIGLDPGMNYVAAVIFAILGILFAATGYTMRPKVAVPTPIPTAPPLLPAEPSPLPSPPPVEEKAEEPPATPPPPMEEQVPSIPTTPPPAEEAPIPAPTLEEPAKVEEEQPAEKPVKRRRRKKTA